MKYNVGLVLLFMGIICFWFAIAVAMYSEKDAIAADGVGKRIVGKETTVYSSREYQIIEVDGVEYISTRGGICPLVRE